VPLTPNKSTGETGSGQLESYAEENDERQAPDRTLSSVQPTDIAANAAKASHTSSKPNWALAPDPSPEGNSKKNSRRRRRGNRRDEDKGLKTPHPRSRAANKAHQTPRNGDMEFTSGQKCDSGSTADGNEASTTAKATCKPPQDRGSPYSGLNKARSRVSSLKSHSFKDDNSPGQGDKARSALHLAQVDALIRELQRTRGPSSERGNRATPARAASVPPVFPPASSGDCKASWVAGHDGVLRPDILIEDKVPAAPALVPGLGPTLPVTPPFLLAERQALNDVFAGLHPYTISGPRSAGFNSYGTRPQRGLEARMPRHLGGAFPAAFDSPEKTMATDEQVGRSHSWQPSEPPTGCFAEEEIINWRSSKMPRRSGVASPNGSGPSTPANTPAKEQHWPTLDEICASKLPSS
jgi:hypothetical protein